MGAPFIAQFYRVMSGIAHPPHSRTTPETLRTLFLNFAPIAFKAFAVVLAFRRVFSASSAPAAFAVAFVFPNH